MTVAAVDRNTLETKVKDMYTDVATNPHGDFHFEMGRAMAERLGYPPGDLDRIPSDAIESFAGVGYFFHLANLQPGEAVVDLGSGSAMRRPTSTRCRRRPSTPSPVSGTSFISPT